MVNVKLDKKRKVPVSLILRAFGYETDADILNAFKGEDEWISKYLSATLDKDKSKNRMDALFGIYKLLRPGDLGTNERVEQLFQSTFYDAKRFDLGELARIKINRKLAVYPDHTKATDMPESNMFLVAQDFLFGLKYLFSLCDGRA